MESSKKKPVNKKLNKNKTVAKKVTNKKKNSKKKKIKGFTLVELLAVIVILAVVMLIAITSVGPMMSKSRKSALATEGIALIEAANSSFNTEMLKGTSAQYKSTDAVCFDIKYLCENGYFEKGCSDDNYIGSVLIVPNNGKYESMYWITNGTYAYLGASDGETDPEYAYDYDSSMDSVLTTCANNLTTSSVTVSGNAVSTTVDTFDNVKNTISGKTLVDVTSTGITEVEEVDNSESFNLYYVGGPVRYTINVVNGTTWGEWVNSKYNTEGWIISTEYYNCILAPGSNSDTGAYIRKYDSTSFAGDPHQLNGVCVTSSDIIDVSKKYLSISYAD